ncbi:hypothetical protein H6503_04750 [Candidatus Woesearchaeota archaeon]|nr:hypothetical protein [Candidatus Woesearchaeota archaeon]
MENIIIVDKKKLSEKIQSIREDGKENLHIVSDFDQTLTKAFHDGQKTHSSFAQIRGRGYLDPEYVKQSYELFDYYYPIEISPEVSQEEKNRCMQEWWEKHLDLMIKYGMKRSILQEIATKGELHPRGMLMELMSLMEEEDIPLLILSAGLGDVIMEFLKAERKLTKNLHVISNFYRFNDAGEVIGYQSKVIHTFNKNEYGIRDTDYFKEVEHRKNVILLGDNLGDCNMADGLEHSNVIKIGFLNENVDEFLPLFKKEFDIILLDDQDLGYVIDLVSGILNKNVEI